MAEFQGLANLEIWNRLGEIRRRLIWSAVVLVATFALSYLYTPFILQQISEKLKQLIFLSPAEAFFSRLKLAFVMAVIITAPYVLWHIWRFASPGLKRKQRRSSFWLIPISFALFSAGASFAFFVVAPLALRFFLSFASTDLEALISVDALINFVIGLVIPFGFMFEMPVLMLFLAKVGLVKPEVLVKNRKFAVLIIFILAAILTPTPDAIAQISMALPMLLLFEVSILVIKIVWRKRLREAEMAE
ncbi:MAG: twin-arginine translocase subunit TatC [Firmicutes bacterium]|nr:twin-arginine translocase subunit TatC [Bacillota bacterium]